MAEAALDTTQFTGRSRKGDAARVALLDAARRIAARDGIDAIRLSAVADEANIAHATAYGYFRSRRELLQSVVAEDLNALSRAMRAVAGLPEPPDAPPPPSHIVRYELKSQVEKASDHWSEQNEGGHAAKPYITAEDGDRLPATAANVARDNTSIPGRDPALGESLDRRIAYIERKLSYLEENARQAAEVLSRDVESLCNSFAALAQIDEADQELRPVKVPAATDTAATVAAMDDGILQLELADAIPDDSEAPEDAPKTAGESDKPMPEVTSEIGETQMTQHDSNIVPVDAKAAVPQGPEAAPRAVPVDYLTVARRAAMSAVASQISHSERTKSEQKRRETRWMIIAAAVAGVLLVGAAISFRELATRPAAVVAQAKPANEGITYSSAHAKTTMARALTPLDRITAEARAGKPEAELAIGLKYLSGDGIPKDEHEAATWIARAAEAGDQTAQSWLGTLYQHGRGVTADPAVAFSWFEKAAQQGNRKAMHNLAVAYAQGSGVALNYFEAARWFARAADLGYVDSAFNLAVLYERGDGVPQSLVDAYKWYAIAAAAGDAESRTRMSAIESELSPEDLAAAQRAAAAFKSQENDANVSPKT
jgi:TPR repeat protein/AcrR family transcriptional regulator